MGMFVELKWKEYNNDLIQKITDIKRVKEETQFYSLNEWGQQESVFDVGEISKDHEGIDLTLRLPIIEEVQFDGRSNFVAASDFFGGQMVSTIQRFANIFSAMSGTATSLSALFDYQLWDKTEPLRLSLEVTLSTQTNVLYDVVYPAESLMNLSALTHRDNGGFAVPGVNLANFKEVQRGYLKENKIKNSEPTGVSEIQKNESALLNIPYSKFIEVSMPMFHSKGMLVVESRPQWNSQTAITSAGEEYPASVKVSLQLQSLFPMDDTLIFSSGYIT